MPRSALAFVLALPFLALGSRALAASIRAEGNVIYVNEVAALKLKATVAGLGAGARAALVAKRLAAVSEPIRLEVKPTPTAQLLTASGVVLMQIDAADAAAEGVALPELAARWRTAVQSALALPALKLDRTAVMLRAGAQAEVRLVGSEAASATITVSDPAVAQVDTTLGGLRVRAVGPGQATVTLVGTSASARLNVTSLAAAAVLPTDVSAEVIGAPASAETVAEAARGAVVTRLGLQPGALVVAESTTSPLLVGESRTVDVRVRVTAPNAYPVETAVPVRVVNLPIARSPEAELWYCNEPETVRAPQKLFQGTIVPGKPVRMLYHHVNESGRGLLFRVDAANPGDAPARLAVTLGDSKPDRNPVLAGLLAGVPFFREWLAGSAEVITIPPHTSVPISLRRLAPGETASGLGAFGLLPGSGGPLRVTAAAVEPFAMDTAWAAATMSATPWREVPPQPYASPAELGADTDLVFPNPFKDESATYRMGGPFVFLRIGQRPIGRKGAGRPLDGNFGVIYRVVARAENPTNASVDVEVVFEASAGYSGGVFSVDGDVRRVGPIQAKAEVQLARMRLAPGASREVRIVTMPLSGSSYPATIIVRPVQSLALPTG